MHDLSGIWDLADGEGEHRVPMAVPGDVHSALLAAGVIPDPYVGRNEDAVRWVVDRDWTLTRRFRHWSNVETTHTFFADCLDCIAEVRLNGALIGRSETAFRAVAWDVSGALVEGENVLEITFRSATAEANRRAVEQPFPVPYHKGNCPIPNGNMLRKPQCDFGWDWGIALAPVSVSGAIGIARGAGVFRDVQVVQRHLAGRVRVAVTARIDGVAIGETAFTSEGAPPELVPWKVWLCGVEASGVVEADAERRVVFRAELDIESPELWHPAGYGAQPIHELRIAARGLRRVLPVALRDVRLVSEPDAAGRSLALHVNGRPVFCRGANWIPADALPGRITAERTRALLQSAADANMNMIRVWGGGRYEPDSFYEACDALGLLVWQDFMFACHLYPSTEAFLAEVGREVEEQAARLGRFVALWCGDNELLGALGWFEESRANRDRYLVAYDRLNRTIEASLKRVDPGANWWPSSPSPGPMSFGDAWHDDSSGDMHFWSVWHEGRDFEHYRDVRPRFCSEFGFQSYPSMEVVRSFAGPEDLNIASPVMESHQKDAGGAARIAGTMFRYFRFPEGFGNFVWLSQIQQGVALKTAVDYWRSLKPHCMGTLYWQLNDVWPGPSWSSLDYRGGWKLLHHMARRFFAPVNVAAIPEGQGFRLVGINDTAAPVEVTVEAFAAAMDGATRALGCTTARVGTEAAAPLGEAAVGPGEILAFRWRASNGAAGGDHALAGRYKGLDLRDPGLTVTTESRDGACVATVATQALALFVTLEADRPGRFSTNALTLFPGHPAEIVFTPADGEPADVRLTTRDLWSSARPPAPVASHSASPIPA
ncbi:glycoside hydrolase family 2 protein [Amaricoccus sp.]|uniref:beta-mannosidase n=1 Tax=Amaricoccus sp. TaxID=1872485 RepID=UPI001B74373D|nr:glycoside hydrolase family 2 protein [Amaricoccus sp.]MBP7002472.1 glycoside hydrolase family 2 protein [Amaricoccus sp.]